MKVISESDMICIREYLCCAGVQAAWVVWSLNCLNALSVNTEKRNSTQWRISTVQFLKCSFICKAWNKLQHWIFLWEWQLITALMYLFFLECQNIFNFSRTNPSHSKCSYGEILIACSIMKRSSYYAEKSICPPKVTQLLFLWLHL